MNNEINLFKFWLHARPAPLVIVRVCMQQINFRFTSPLNDMKNNTIAKELFLSHKNKILKILKNIMKS